MAQIKYHPIFNHSDPAIMNDFVRVSTTADPNTTINRSHRDIVNQMQHDIQSPRRLVFAYGAYDGNCLVGYLRARSNGARYMEFADLYVLPEYQHMGIGSRLAALSEQAASLHRTSVSLIAAARACKFWEGQKFKSIYGANTYHKSVSVPKCATIPVFGTSQLLSRKISHLTDHYNEKSPVFAYTDVNAAIVGIAIGSPLTSANPYKITEYCITPQAASDWVAHRLDVAFANARTCAEIAMQNAINPNAR